MEEPKIIFENDNFFVVDKPAGYITNEADTVTNQPVLQTWIRENFDYPLKGNREARDGIVHRLDKETSGVIIVAKNQETFTYFQNAFKNREVQKKYIALLHGKIDPSEGEIKATVGRLPWRRSRFGVLPGGRESETTYKLIKFYPGNNGGHSLVEFYPKTGRTHQIRVHAKHIGHAIVADEFYAGRKTARNDRKWCPRLFLHATSIRFQDPLSGKYVEYESDIPDELANVLTGLER